MKTERLSCDLSERIKRQAKAAAAIEGVTLQEFVERAIKEYLARHAGPKGVKPCSA
jgi:predicted HicB family RNase H-like nuclease